MSADARACDHRLSRVASREVEVLPRWQAGAALGGCPVPLEVMVDIQVVFKADENLPTVLDLKCSSDFPVLLHASASGTLQPSKVKQTGF
jgi:hypothetical protein